MRKIEQTVYKRLRGSVKLTFFFLATCTATQNNTKNTNIPNNFLAKKDIYMPSISPSITPSLMVILQIALALFLLIKGRGRSVLHSALQPHDWLGCDQSAKWTHATLFDNNFKMGVGGTANKFLMYRENIVVLVNNLFTPIFGTKGLLSDIVIR